MYETGSASLGPRDFDDLATLNEIIGTLNRAVDVRGVVGTALAHIVELMGLESGLIYVRSQAALGGDDSDGFELAAQFNLPPALTTTAAADWSVPCQCQRLFQRGELDEAVNMVGCSRHAAATGDKRGLGVHATAPLRSGERVLGIMNVIAQDRSAFGERELALLTNVGSQMGVALERARLYDLLRDRRIEEQAALLSLSNELLGRLDLEDVVDHVVAEARHLLHADASALLLPQGKPDHLAFRAASGWRRDPIAAGVDVAIDEESGPGLVMRSQRPLVLADIEAERPELCAWARDLMRHEGFRSHALVALIVDGRSVGTLMIDSRQPRALDEDEVRLLQLMANQAAIAVETSRLHEDEVERLQLERELAVARQIQLGLLPEGTASIPGWDIALAYEAARQVGGDFYDVFELPGAPNEWGIVVADVADKGVPAALMMAVSRTVIRATASEGRSPAAALEMANRVILEESQGGLFVTALYGILESETGRFTFANAGHVRPLWGRGPGDVVELATRGIALGVLDQIELEEHEIELKRGDALVLYTDGVSDAVDQDDQPFGASRTRAALAEVSAAGGASAEQIVSAIVGSVESFSGGAPQTDDLALLALVRRANPSGGVGSGRTQASSD